MTTASWRTLSEEDDAMLFAHDRGLLDSPTGRTLMDLRIAGHSDPEIDSLISERARHELYCERMGTANPFRPVTLPVPRGPIFVGFDVRTGAPVYVTPASLRRHFLLIARTGAGKSVLVVNLLMSLLVVRDAPGVRGIWLMDAYKHELRRVLPLFRRVGRSIAVLTPRTTPFNLLQVPKDHDPLDHAAVVCDVLASTFSLPDGATRLLLQSVHALYVKFGVRNGTAAYPNLYDLFEHVRRDPHANAASKDALLDRLRELLLALTPKAAAWRIGWTPAELAKRSVLWELGGSAEIAKNYLLDAFVNGALRDQLRTPCTSMWPTTVMFLDDAQRLVSVRGSTGRMSPLAEVLLVCRSAGTAIILGHQSTEGVERLILSQLGTRFVGQLGLASDWMWAKQELGLNSAQIDYCRHKMNPGMFIVQSATAESGARYPHLVQVPNITWPTVTDDEVEASRVCLSDLPLVPAPEFERWEPWPIVHVAEQVAPTAESPNAAEDEDQDEQSGLDAADLAFLRAIVDHPGIASSELPNLAGLSPRRALEIRERLVQSGYLRVHRVSTSARGRRSLILEPLEPALRAIGVTPGKEVRA